MALQLKNPLVVFDLETTGIQVTKDRIIELAFIKITPQGERTEKEWRINPEMPIPAETSAIHKIFDHDVADKPTFKQIAKNIAQFLEGCDLAGFNIMKFDLPMLMEEFLRAEIDFDISKKRIIDAQKIFHMMEKRTLSAAYAFYCQKTLEDAHHAMADTKATLAVLEEQVIRYDGQDASDNLGKTIGKFKNDMQSLHVLTNTGMVDLAGRFILDENGVEIFNFGKHKNKSIMQVLKEEPSFYEWMMKGDFPLDTKRKLTEIKLRMFKK